MNISDSLQQNVGWIGRFGPGGAAAAGRRRGYRPCRVSSGAVPVPVPFFTVDNGVFIIPTSRIRKVFFCTRAIFGF